MHETIETVRPSREAILAALHTFVSQRSGIECGNYGDLTSFMADYRTILRDGRDARRMLAEARFGDVLDYLDVSGRGRLAFLTATDGTLVADYTAGQYFPTEYRAGVCGALACAYWAYWREHGATTREAIQAKARKLFGRGIASRWFR